LIAETQGGHPSLIAQWCYAQRHPPVNDYTARLLAPKKNEPGE
jgi:hypothetical protein